MQASRASKLLLLLQDSECPARHASPCGADRPAPLCFGQVSEARAAVEGFLERVGWGHPEFEVSWRTVQGAQNVLLRFNTSERGFRVVP